MEGRGGEVRAEWSSANFIFCLYPQPVGVAVIGTESECLCNGRTMNRYNINTNLTYSNEVRVSHAIHC